MEAPNVEGLTVRCLAGAGGCGEVYLAEDAAGGRFALKVFDSMAIQRSLLARMTGRLQEGGWPEGVMPVVSSDFEGRPAVRVTPWVGDGDPEVKPGLRPRSLQHRLDEFPGEKTWSLVRALARALGAMHGRRVAHGNLKPGNVFFDEAGGVLLTDWALGNMPGAGRLEFTDALLYEPPEQLVDAAGYAEESGYRWDVFAFGVLAYRVMTGRFPRCHEAFSAVAPACGATRVEGFRADLPGIARQLTAEPEPTWPDEARNPLEAGFRRWIEQCLALAPLQRPATMLEVAAGLDAVEEQVAVELERQDLLNQRRRANRRVWLAALVAVAAVAVAVAAGVGLGGLWQSSESHLRQEKQQRQSENRELTERADVALKASAQAEKRAEEAKVTLESERVVSLAQLQASRLMGDHLFAWAMAGGQRALPPLDGREQRLRQLESYFEDFLTRTAEVAELAGERARARLQLAEIALASGDADAATQRLGVALEALDGQPMAAELRLRLATDRLLLALLRQSDAAFADARKALAEIPQADADADRVSQLTAILDFHEANRSAARGEDAKALEQLTRATQTLNRLADQRPDSAVLQSELAACYLSSASVLEGIGTPEDAREVRTKALRELSSLLKKSPDDFALRLELAECNAALAEAALQTGDARGAETLSKEAIRLLGDLLAEQPDNREAQLRMAAQLGLSADLMRDRGQAAAALAAFDEALGLLEKLRAAAPDDPNVKYRLALLGWQKAKLPAAGGKHDEEIRLTTEARAILRQLEAEHQSGGPSVEQIQRSTGYLLGDLGHALQVAKKKAEAKTAFEEAAGYWETLVKAHPKSDEYAEARAWCRQRLKALK